MTDWANRRELRHLRRIRDRLPDVSWAQGIFALGVVAGLASLLIYHSRGYSRTMLLIWLLALVALSVFFSTKSQTLPRIARGDLLAPVGLMLGFAPLFLLGLYSWPVQVGSDEVTIISVAKAYAHPHGVDPFGVSFYLGRPALLFIGWGKLGELIGDFDLYHMRLLHALVGLLVIVATYALLRQLLPRGWAILATCVFGASHAYFMISRLAMRENTSVLVEVVALALLLWGLRNEHPLVTFWGGVIAGLGFYVYQPARATLPIWLVFLLVLGLVSRRTFPVRRLLTLGSVAVAGFVLMATPILIAESKVTPQANSDSQRETLMIYPEARRLQQQWVSASSVAAGYKKNVKYGLTTYNNKVVDHAYIYENKGHGFIDPLTGILLWLGVGLVGLRLIRGRADEGAVLVLTAFLVLWLSLAFVVNKAPNYTRLLITLPFVAYFVAEAVRWLAGRWRSIPRASYLLVGVTICALIAWNLSIAWDYIQTGRRAGEPVGTTGRYVAAHRDIPGEMFYISAAENQPWMYYGYGGPSSWLDRLRLFTKEDRQVGEPIDPNSLAAFKARAPFALFMRREVWELASAQLRDRYPSGRLRNITTDGSRVVLEVPAAT
jgi:hypothetical protein